MTDRTRERTLFVYANALERGDFETVARILHMAETDGVLDQMIAELHATHESALHLPDERPAPTDAQQFKARGIQIKITFRNRFSPDGRPPKTDPDEEEPNMFTTFVPARSPYYDGARKLRWDLIAWAAAIVVMAVLGFVLLYMRAPEMLPEYAVQPESCMAEGQNPQEESVRLAGEAAALLETRALLNIPIEDRPAAFEQAGLLALCALQAAYTPEADRVVQQVVANEGVVQSFTGNGDSAVFSPDGRYLLTADDTVLRLWDSATGEEIREFVGHTEYIQALAFSPDGHYILSGSADTTARLWDVETGQEVRQFVGHTRPIQMGTVAFSPDGRSILTGSDDTTVRLWDAETGEEIRRFTGHSMPIFGAAFSPDGRYVATSSWDTTVRLWDADTGGELRQYATHNSWAAQLTFSSDGKYLLSSGTYVVRLSDVESGETIREYTAQGSRTLDSPNFSPDGRYVLASDRDNKLALLWDAETAELVRVFDARAFDADAWRAHNVRFSPDGQSIAMAMTGINNAPHLVWLWDTDYHDTIARACEHVARDFTPEERAQYGLGEGAACP